MKYVPLETAMHPPMGVPTEENFDAFFDELEAAAVEGVVVSDDHLARLVSMYEDAARGTPRGEDGRDEEAIDSIRAALESSR